MLLDLVLGSFIIVLVPLALGLVWQQTAAVVQGIASTFRGQPHGPAKLIAFLPSYEADGLHEGRGRTGSGTPGETTPGSASDLLRNSQAGRESMDEHAACLWRCDRLIADAEGDAPLQAFWLGVKCEYQADLPGRFESSTPTRLIAVEGGPDIPVGPTPVIVGRDPWCDARLDSILVSRIHCCLTEVDGEVVVLDLGSVNGTRLNGQKVELGRLRFGDELSIAHLRYCVEGVHAT